LVPNTAPPPANIVAPDSTANQGLEDVAFLGIQYSDVFVTPTTVPALGPVVINSTPAPFAVVSTVNSAGVPVSCTVPAPTNAAFTIAALPSTGTYSITLSTAIIGTFSGTATFACGGDNGSTIISFSGTVTGQMTAAPSATLTATSVINSGILQPYNTTPGDATIRVQVTAPAGSIPYKVSETGRSANWPTCGLIYNLPGSPAGTATIPPGSQFSFTINSSCANQLALGTYTENIAIAPVTSGLANTISLPFSLTITNGGVIVQSLTDFFFGASTTPQVSNLTVQAPAGGLNYVLVFMPPTENITPLPAANASILSGARGAIPGTGSAQATVQINPVGLANGVYGFCYLVSSVQLPQNNSNNPMMCSRVYVGSGLGFIAPVGGTLYISVPVGFTAANITQPTTNGNFPPQINVTGLANVSVSPYSVTSAVGAFTPALPAGAFTLTANNGSPCTTYAENSTTSPYHGPSCQYTVTIDSTALTAQTYVGTVTFTGGGFTATVNVNLTATQYPQLSWVNQQGVAMPPLTLTGVVGSNTTFCTNSSAWPGIPAVMATGGVIPNVTLTLLEISSPSIPWLGFNGTTGAPGNLGTTNPINFTIANPLSAPGFYTQNICFTAATITKPGTYTGSVTVSGGGVGSVAVLPVNFIVSGTGVSNVGVYRAGQWLLDANGNTLWDAPGPGLDTYSNFGGLVGDVPITGDWSGNGTTKIGVYRNGAFLLDYNGSGLYDGSLADRYYQFMTPVAGDIPVTGDWTGTGTTKIGIYRPSTGQWFLDMNGNGVFDPGTDAVVNYGGLAGDVPVTGDWNGNGITKIGIFRAGFYWILDANGNGVVDAGDLTFAYGGIAGDVPVVGDWNGNGKTKVGVFRLGFFFVLDTNGDQAFTSGDQAFPFGGLAGDVPVIGKWAKP
jgi:hypothetical protein